MKTKRTGNDKSNASHAHPPAYRNPRLPVEKRVADLLGRMTLEEKAAQLYCSNWEGEAGAFDLESAPGLFDAGTISRPSFKSGPRETAVFTNAVQKRLIEGTRLGIPALFHEELLHGLMGKGATSFPQAIALASTWDPALVERVFAAAAAETRSRGSNYALTPVLDLARDPRWGRTEETYGEDPYLVSRIGVAAIKGLQGPGPMIDKRHVLATAKHFAVHGQPEGGANAAPGNYSERIIREQFLAPFHAAVVEAGVQVVMASYNEIDGVPAHVNKWLLHKVLRKEWGFKGFVTSDGHGIPQLVTVHHVAASNEEAARRALEAGVDAELGNCFASLAAQVKKGQVSEEILDQAVARVLRAKFLLGLFDDPYVDPDEAERINNCPEHQQLALEAARKAIVLLKNETGLLPLDPREIRSIAVIGPNAAAVHPGGYSGDPGRGVSILEGVRDKVGARITVQYAEGCPITLGKQGWEAWWEDNPKLSDPAQDAKSIAEAARLARSSDAAIVVVGENEHTCREAWSATHLGDRDSLDLLGQQDALIRAVVETGTPTVVVLINGRPLSITYAAEHVPAILECWYLGQETGTAVADVLFGDVNPGGKLPITFPRSVGQLPAYYYQKPSARRGYLFSSAEPLFPFGHGLSYTTFAYSNLRVSPQRIGPREAAKVSVDVANTGKRAGDEVVQLYIRDRVASVTQPVKLLKGFERITLQPGETRTVTFVLTPDKLSFLDEHLQRVVEPGLFDVMAGGSSASLLSTTLEVRPSTRR